ncbi:DNA adenine methylase [bacterium]|jgi:DNA adenine methylase|nr:DNA adenine methylase [bacterium]
MSISKKPLRPPFKWHGGKHYLARKIIEYFLDHSTYVEPFGGAASVLLNKSPSKVEVYNDLDGRLTGFFRILRDEGPELIRRLALTPYSELEFETESVSADDEIEQARRFLVICRQSMGGRGDSYSCTLHRSRRGMADVVSGYLSAIDDELPRIIERLRCVQIVCRDAVEVIQKWDSPDTLFYCDPPYLPETRTTKSVYTCEMNDEGHRKLAETLLNCKGQVILSGYSSPMYDELFHGWHKVSFDLPNNAASGSTKSRKQEVLWMNFDPPAIQVA